MGSVQVQDCLGGGGFLCHADSPVRSLNTQIVMLEVFRPEGWNPIEGLKYLQRRPREPPLASCQQMLYLSQPGLPSSGEPAYPNSPPGASRAKPLIRGQGQTFRNRGACVSSQAIKGTSSVLCCHQDNLPDRPTPCLLSYCTSFYPSPFLTTCPFDPCAE